MNSMKQVADRPLAEDWTYGVAEGAPVGLPLALSIYADRAHVRGTLREDAQAAGLRVSVAADLSALGRTEARPLGDVVLVDCPVVDAASLAALTELDLRAACAGTKLIVSTSEAALDDVFGCLDQSGAQILVDPDRVIALGHVLAQFPSARLRELSEDERHLLMRLTEQVGQIAGRIKRLSPPHADGGAGANVTVAEASRPKGPHGLRCLIPA